jgi:hypothetical protein
MQKWEYHWICASPSAVNGRFGKNAPFSEGKTLSEFMDYLGSKGWELVSVVLDGGTAPAYHYYWFKRLIE